MLTPPDAFMNLHPWPSFGSLGWSTTPWALWEGTEKGLGRARRGPWPLVSVSRGGMGFMKHFILEYQVNPGKNQGFSYRQRILGRTDIPHVQATMWIVCGTCGWEVRVKGKGWIGSVWTSRANQNDGAFCFCFWLFFLLLTCITLAYAHALPGQGMGKLTTSKATSQRAVLVSKSPGKKSIILNSSREVEAPDVCTLAAELKGLLNSAQPEALLNKGDCGQHHINHWLAPCTPSSWLTN